MAQYQNRVRGVVIKKKSAAVNSPAKRAPAKKVPAKKTPAKKVPVKKAAAKKAPAKKAPAKKIAAVKTSAKKVPAKKAPVRPALAKSTPVLPVASIAPISAPPVAVEERRLVMPPPPRPAKSGKKVAPLKPIKIAPLPVVVADSEAGWSAGELKSVRVDLSKELLRLKSELAAVEIEMDELIRESGEGAGDDQADAGTKTFEREHEMSLVINARDMVLQTERALERIDDKSYGRCEECGNSIGKARLQVFPRATLCMSCKQKEERR